jgi:hypothetical protein
MAKQVLLPAARRVDDVIVKAGARPVNSQQQIPNGDPKGKGREIGSVVGTGAGFTSPVR